MGQSIIRPKKCLKAHIPKKPRKRVYLESNFQCAVIQWASLATLRGVKIIDHLFAIPNGGGRTAREGARLKREGVKAGVSDLFFAYPTQRHAGLWLELKRDAKSKPSPDQIKWIDSRIKVGYEARVCSHLDEVIEIVQNYLKGY